MLVLALVTRWPVAQRADDVIERWIGRRRSSLEPVARITTLPGESYVHPSIGVAVCLAVLHAQRSVPWRVALAMGSASLLAILAHHAVKLVYRRARPQIALGKGKTEPAYPSGHTTDATAVLLTGAYVLACEGLVPAPAAFTIAVVLAILTGVSRVALGWHWATDVLGGWLTGIAVFGASAALYDLLQ